jgi:hypothetical protein
MDAKTRNVRDAFAISLGGLSTRSPFVVTPFALDRPHSALDEKPGLSREDQPDTDHELSFGWGRFWLRTRRRAV